MRPVVAKAFLEFGKALVEEYEKNHPQKGDTWLDMEVISHNVTEEGLYNLLGGEFAEIKKLVLIMVDDGEGLFDEKTWDAVLGQIGDEALDLALVAMFIWWKTRGKR